ncbi:MAG: DNA helicase PriA [Chloroflexi bacterium]|nr:DNA helicase PriA [Chloroflexota bacterium]
MNDLLITCPVCGSLFDPNENAACQSCPLHKGCLLTRCPTCGFETVNTRQSRLANLATRLFSRFSPASKPEGGTHAVP